MASKTCNIYIACSAVDAALLEPDPKTCYNKTVQGGRALTSLDINADFRDNEGEDHISEKNKVYCELTVLYWIWKNDKSDYVGLEHYRRRFDYTEEELNSYFDNNVDAILPTILPSPPLELNYKYAHYGNDWKIMMEVLKELYPDFYQTAQQVFAESRFIPCNMGIYQKDYFSKYCTWLFSILFEVEKRSSEKIDIHQNRYIGYLAERLHTLYVFHHLKEQTYNYVFIPYKQLKTFDAWKEELNSLTITQNVFKEYIYSLHEKNQITKAKNFFFDYIQQIEADDEIDKIKLLYSIYDRERTSLSQTIFDTGLTLEEQLKQLDYFLNNFYEAYSNNSTVHEETLLNFILEKKISSSYILIAASTLPMNQVIALNKLSMVLVEQKEHLKALQIMNTVYKCSQDDLTVFNLAQILYLFGKYDSALSVLDSVKNSTPSILALKELILSHLR